jgi:hypothetical protein
MKIPPGVPEKEVVELWSYKLAPKGLFLCSQFHMPAAYQSRAFSMLRLSHGFGSLRAHYALRLHG